MILINKKNKKKRLMYKKLIFKMDNLQFLLDISGLQKLQDIWHT